MAVTQPKSQIPTVAQAVELFLNKKGLTQRVVEHRSVLQGPKTKRVTGRRASGTALACSNLGGLRFDRVTGDDFAAWFGERHPAEMAADSKKRGRSSLKQLLDYAIASGWADPTVLAALPTVKASPPRREWLRPEQVAALCRVIEGSRLTDEQRFMWSCLLNTGVRVAELVALRADDLNAIDCTVKVIGKGEGDGKLRHIPVSTTFRDEWQRYVLAHHIKPHGWLFRQSAWRFQTGHYGASERVITDGSKHCTAKAGRTAMDKLVAEFDDALRRGGISPELRPSFSITPKVLRRTYACSNLIMAEQLGSGYGLDLRSLQVAMGHASLETTANYLTDVQDYLNRHRRPVSLADGVEMLLKKQAEAVAA
jgi:site-specific recombinase XerD